ncbi:PucR family transcriptional regulator [Amycolatopsis sp.]|uniref:PucR family transcriptional regulator n=1 Tax=Amycolatopsis sp. TaxID=37632 RepID=UPI002E07435F|nr:PucR family transcriptional regulator [Amycolatopsis sp.]
MALTLRGLVAERSLGLRVRAGEEALDRPIGWVHPTDLLDPTPFLEGGELLLTNGLTLDEDTAPDYVRRLVDAGVAGLGFGVGMSHDRIPAALVKTAAEVGLPLIEVPRPTPFIAITKAVSRAIATDEYASLVRTGRGQQELTRSAVGEGGPAAVIRKLAKLTGGWVQLLDAAGNVTEVAPASGRSFDLRDQVRRLRGGTRLASSGLRLGEHEVVVQALDTPARGYLAVGTETPMDAADQYIVNTAASLLSLALEQNREHGAALRGLRSGLLDLLIDGQVGLAVKSISTLWGGVPAEPWSVLVVSGNGFFDALDAEFEGVGERIFFAESGASVVVVCTADSHGWVEELAERAGARVGVSDSTVDIATGLVQARQALAAAQTERVPVVRFADHAGRGLLALVAPDAAAAFATGLLAPLRRHDETGRGDLVASLYCWLEHHGHWDLAATRLGIHRHTLRNRMDKIEALTGRSLASPGVRAELWLALNAAQPG